MTRRLPRSLGVTFAVALAAAVVLLAAPAGESRFGPAASAQSQGAVTLTLLHNSDGESALLPVTNTLDVDGERIEASVGGIAAFKAVMDRESSQARVAGHAVLSVHAGDAYLSSPTLECGVTEGNPLFEAVAQDAVGYDALVIGNHEFDSGPDFLERFIRASGARPFLSANLDFTREPGYADLLDGDGLIEPPVGDGRVVGRSMVVTDAATGARFGLVGATTPGLPVISAPRHVQVTPDLATTAAAVQAEVDRLLARGINRIVLVSHLQSVTHDIQLVGLLSGVDIAVAGGGDELLESPAVGEALQRLPGERAEPWGGYPIRATDTDGRTVYVVTTAGAYQYVGRLDVAFDEGGEVARVLAESSYPRPVVPAGEAASGRFAGAVEPDASLLDTIEVPLRDCLAGFASTPVASTEVLLDVSRDAVRSRESNAGNLVADALLHSYDRHAAGLGLPSRGPGAPVVAIQNGGGIRQTVGDVLPTTGRAPGTIFLLDTMGVLPFANGVTAVPGVVAADLKAAFERSASRYPSTSGAFLQVGGIAVVYDPALPPGSRVVALTLDDGTPLVADGVVVEGAQAVTVVTNRFVADGGDGYTMFAEAAGKRQFPVSYEQALRDYLGELGRVTAGDSRYAPGGEGRITFVQAPSTPSTGSAGVAEPEGATSPVVALALVLAAIAAVASARWSVSPRSE